MGRAAPRKVLEYARNGNLSFRTSVDAYAYDPQQPHAVIDAAGASYRSWIE